MKALTWTGAAMCFWSLAALLLASVKYLPWGISWVDFAGAGNSPAQVIAWIGTPATVIVAIAGLVITYLANKSTRELTIRSEIAATFQKAVEMIGDGPASAVVAGLQLLLDTVTLDTKYSKAGISVIQHYIPERDFEFRTSLRLFLLPRKAQLPETWIASDRTTAEALIILNRLRPGAKVADERIYISGAYLADVIVSPTDLSWLTLDRLVANGVGFVGVDFSNSVVKAYVFDRLKFEGCTFTNAELEFYDFDGKFIGPEQARMVSISGARNADGCTINGAAADRWFAVHKPEPIWD